MGESRRSAVAVGTLGGTITMTRTATELGAVPRLSAVDLVTAVPQLAGRELTAQTLLSLPGASLDETHLRIALSWATDRVRCGDAGVVLVQGTDTLEETAYLADLWWPHDAPLVITGAMRPPDHAGADGGANLLAAVTAAESVASAGRGVLVVLNDEVHAAAFAAKRDSASVAAFSSPSFGPLGRLVEGDVVFAGPPSRPQPFLAPPPTATPRVALLTNHLGDDGRLLDLVADDGYDGVVVAALGVGHTSARFADAVSRVIGRLPVVFATRTGGGSTWRTTYGFEGSEQDLLARGAVGAGWLSPPKARVLLSTLLALGFDQERIVAEFASRGMAPRTSGAT